LSRSTVRNLQILSSIITAARRVGTVRQIFDFGAWRARCAAPPPKNRRLSPFGAKFTRGRSRKGVYEIFDFGARSASRTVPTGLTAAQFGVVLTIVPRVGGVASCESVLLLYAVLAIVTH
jgi:hypothetical protein